MNLVLNKKTKFIDLGLKDYQEAWDFQSELFNSILAIKSENRQLANEQQIPTENFLVFVEHPHVFTLGKSGKEENLKIEKENLSAIEAEYYHINRGGDITYHGPGQLVGYPVIDLENFFTDIHRYLRLLEESIILTLAQFGIEAGRIPGLTGVWVDPESETASRKICAFGVKTSRWVTQHGFALNVNTNLDYFNYIIPCGIDDRAVTSMEKELGKRIPMNDVSIVLKKSFAEVFEAELV